MGLGDRGRSAAESLARTERAIRSEIAATLARIAGTLEGLIEELRREREALPGLTGEERSRALARCRDLHRRALLYRWYLVVQREAVGLFRHEDVDRFYRIPPAV